MPKPLQETPAFAVRHVPIADVRENPDNPRTISADKFAALVRSVKTFPEMLALRPLVVSSGMVVLGGNMRLRACREAGLTSVPVVIADALTHAQQREFVIRDNVPFGEWDWDALANDWDAATLVEWGLEVPSPQWTEPPLDNENSAQLGDVSLQVIVTCKTEHEQGALTEELERRGFKCRLLTL